MSDVVRLDAPKLAVLKTCVDYFRQRKIEAQLTLDGVEFQLAPFEKALQEQKELGNE